MKEITVKDVVVELQKRFLGEFTVYLYSMPNEEKDFVDAILLTKKVADVDGEMHTKGVVISPNLNNPQIAASRFEEIVDALEQRIREKQHIMKPLRRNDFLVDLGIKYVLKNTKVRLVELDGNEELLSYAANYQIPDLGLAALFAVCINNETSNHVLLTEHDRKALGVAVEDLYDASNNIEKTEGYSYKLLMDWLNIQPEVREMPFMFGLSEEALKMGAIRKKMEAPFGYGSSAILHTDVLGDVAKQMGGSFYMVPTSLCELVCIPGEIAADVRGGVEGLLIPGNSGVSPDMVLCNHVFKYDRDEGDVSLVL